MFGLFRRRVKDADVYLSADDCPEVEAETQIIQSCRARFGMPPRQLDSSASEACQLELTPDVSALFTEMKDPMLRILKDQATLRDRGQVVWGHLVQANRILFDPTNNLTLPANVIYSMDPHFDGRTHLLARMAHNLFGHKGSVPADRELREFVRVITDERERIMRKELPQSYCGGRSVYFTSCFIQPSHLPGNCLVRPAFPMIVNKEETVAVMLLPSRFWAADLVSQWQSGGQSKRYL